MVHEKKDHASMSTKKNSLFIFIILALTIFWTFPFMVSGAVRGIESFEDVIFVAHDQNAVEIWNVTSGSRLEKIENNVSIWAFDTDGESYIVLATSGSGLQIFNMLKKEWKKINMSSGYVFSVLWESDSGRAYAGLENGEVYKVNVGNESDKHVYAMHDAYVMALVLHEGYLYAASNDGAIKVWDVKRDVPVNISFGYSNKELGVWGAVFADEKIYLAHMSGIISIWDLKTKSLIKEIRAYESDVRAIASDGEYIYSAHIAGRVSRWNLDGEKLEPEIRLDDLSLHPLALTVTSDFLYVGVREGGVLVYDKANLSLIKKIGEFEKEEENAGMVKSALTASREKKFNPMTPILAILTIFFIIILSLDIYFSMKKKFNRITKDNLKKFLSSYADIYDVLSVIGIAGVIVMILGIINPGKVFPYYLPNIKAIYYFDALVKNGALLPVWFVLVPSIGYLTAVKQKIFVKYLSVAVGIAVAISIYMLMPAIV